MKYLHTNSSELQVLILDSLSVWIAQQFYQWKLYKKVLSLSLSLCTAKTGITLNSSLLLHVPGPSGNLTAYSFAQHKLVRWVVICKIRWYTNTINQILLYSNTIWLHTTTTTTTTTRHTRKPTLSYQLLLLQPDTECWMTFIHFRRDTT